MEVNDKNLATLSQMLTMASTDPDPARRHMAEKELEKLTPTPGFALLQLHLVGQAAQPMEVRLLAGTYFRNFVKKHWDSVETIKEGEKETIKQALPELMLSGEARVRPLLSAALKEISLQDFPDRWQTLLPGLVAKLQTPDLAKQNGVLKVINTLFNKYRQADHSDTILLQLQYILQHFANPLIQLFKYTCQQIPTQMGSPPTLKILFSSMKFICNIFLSISMVDIPESFEDHLADWMSGFQSFLTFETQLPELTQGKSEESMGLLHQVQAAIFNILNLYAERYEEEFQQFLTKLVETTWHLLVKVPSEPQYDPLVESALKFLTSIARSVLYPLFGNEQILAQICEGIIVKNIKLRKQDKELFEDDPAAFVRRDVEGHDEGTRRKACYALVKGLRKNFEERVTKLFEGHIGALLNEYGQNPQKNWAAKEAAISLIIALAANKSTEKTGVIEVNPLVPIGQFLETQILPELQSPDNTKHLLLKCSCFSFLVTFRRQLELTHFNVVVPLCANYLAVPSFVVRSYAAMAIEKCLSIRKDNTANSELKFSRQQLSPFLVPVLNGLLTALEPTNTVENPYVMRAVTQVLFIGKEDSFAAIAPTVQTVSKKMDLLYKSSVNAEFVHHMFESLAATICLGCKIEKSLIDQFETALLPIFQKILTEPDADSFSPYVFQILSLLVETRGQLTPTFMPLLKLFTNPKMWEESGNAPALVRLIQAYISFNPSMITAQVLPDILGIFQKLLSSKKNDFLGFYLVESVVTHVQPAVFQQYIPQVFRLVFQRIQSSKTVQLVKSFMIFLCIFMQKHGFDYVNSQLDTVQPGIFTMVLKSLWIPNVSGIQGRQQKKAVAIGSVLALTKYKGLLADAPSWIELLNGVIKLFEGIDDSVVAADYVGVEEVAAFNSAFSTLKYAVKPEPDYFAATPSAHAFFKTEMNTFFQAHGSQIAPSLPPATQQYLQKLFSS